MGITCFLVYPQFKEISNDDYFSKNNEFSTWLKEEKGTFFSELSSEAARELFLSFVKRWNRQKLDARYYEGIARGPRTAHSWKIKQGWAPPPNLANTWLTFLVRGGFWVAVGKKKKKGNKKG